MGSTNLASVEIQDCGGQRTIKVRILITEGLIVFPIMGGLIEERISQIVKIAADFMKPVATTFNNVGIVANPGDDAEEILTLWRKATSEPRDDASEKYREITTVNGVDIAVYWANSHLDEENDGYEIQFPQIDLSPKGRREGFPDQVMLIGKGRSRAERVFRYATQLAIGEPDVYNVYRKVFEFIDQIKNH
ncbi:MAG: hypothetical protein Q7S10_00205 [bacterium]|nr:hypothetical protein [bacterium]